MRENEVIQLKKIKISEAYTVWIVFVIHSHGIRLFLQNAGFGYIYHSKN